MNSKQLFWCRAFLIIAALLIIGAYINGFRFLRTVFINEYRIATILTILAGFYIAQGIKESAKSMFDTSDKLWFVCFSGYVYVIFILFLFSTMFLMLSTTIIDSSAKRALHPEQMIFLLPASSIVWMLAIAAPQNRNSSWKNTFRLPRIFSTSRPKNTYALKQPLKKRKNSIHKRINYLKHKSDNLMKGLRKWQK